ncbi:hypothetical protein FS749_000600 [Ceratobasidium sp. UAMH 11750]|nr:hypothetical protein FS749_000600 [Ceratobasidium sp. UAMH 11750]
MSELGAVSSSGVGAGKLEKTKEIMRHISQFNKYTLGDFFETLLSSSDQLDANSPGGNHRCDLSTSILLKACRQAAADVRIQKSAPPSSPEYLALPPCHDFLPPKVTDEEEIERARYSAREGLEEWAARLMLHRVDFEAGLLEKNLQKSAGPTWEKLEDFSLSRERAVMKANAPVLWGVLSVAGLARRKNARQSYGNPAGDETDSGEDSDSDWDSDLERRNQPQGMARGSAQKATELGVASSIYMLLGSRNRLVGFFRTFNGVSLFTSGAPKFIYRLLSWLRLSPSHQTQLSYLELLAASAKANLRQIGQSVFSAPQDSTKSGSMDLDPPPVAFMLLFDNIQRYVKPRTATVGNQSVMKMGTAATLVVLHNVKAGAFDRGPYFANLLLGERQNLTLEDLYAAIDQAHLERVGTATIMHILVNNIQALRHLKKDVENRFKDPNYCAKRPQVARKSCIYPMATSGINEGTAGGTAEVMDDLIGQLGIPPNRFDSQMCLVGGDQASINSL